MVHMIPELCNIINFKVHVAMFSSEHVQILFIDSIGLVLPGAPGVAQLSQHPRPSPSL